MGLKHVAIATGMAVTAATGLTSTAWAAPADDSVTERQCFTGDGRVQREADGVGTCVGGTHDGILVDDGIDHGDDPDGTSSSRSGYDDDGYGRSRADDSDDSYGDDDSAGYRSRGDDDESGRGTSSDGYRADDDLST